MLSFLYNISLSIENKFIESIVFFFFFFFVFNLCILGHFIFHLNTLFLNREKTIFFSSIHVFNTNISEELIENTFREYAYIIEKPIIYREYWAKFFFFKSIRLRSINGERGAKVIDDDIDFDAQTKKPTTIKIIIYSAYHAWSICNGR